MLERLKAAKKVTGVKQVGRALKQQQATCVFLAEDADPRVTGPILQLCQEQSIPVESVATMLRLGELCGIAVGSAVASIVE